MRVLRKLASKNYILNAGIEHQTVATMILAGDIGGTKSHFGVFDGHKLVFEAHLPNSGFADFESAIGAFIASHASIRFSSACLAVAGPIGDNRRQAQLTNLPWHIDADLLSHKFTLPPVKLVNDFAAAAMGAVITDSAQLVSLQAGIPLAGAPRLVVGAGTGLGMALVLPEANAWRIVPGEGGHLAFAPADVQQVALWSFLHERYGRVTWERVISGPGLAAIHEFLGGPPTAPEAIGAAALAQPDSLAGAALNLFLRAYGAFAGDMALAILARGGVFLAGGIAGQIVPAVHNGLLIAAFNSKQEHAAIAAQMPVHIAIDPALGLRGAAALALAGV